MDDLDLFWSSVDCFGWMNPFQLEFSLPLESPPHYIQVFCSTFLCVCHCAVLMQ